MGQLGFFNVDDRYDALDAKGDPLAKLDQIIPWEQFRPQLEAVWATPEEERKSPAGRKPWDAIVIFKGLILGVLYNLSDEQIEYQIRDRLSFSRFCGTGIEGRVPDATTFWLYREQLTRAGAIAELFQAFDHYLASQGYRASGGQIVDASIVSVPIQRNSRRENESLKQDLLRRVRRCGYGDPHSHPAPGGDRRGFAPAARGRADASSRLAPPAGATRRRGQRRRRRRPRRRNGCGLKQAVLRSGARVDAPPAHVRKGGSHPSCAPADGEAAGFAARSRAPRRLPAAGAERRELTLCLATPHLRDDGRRPSRSSRSSPRSRGSSRVPRRSPRPAHPRLLRLPALSTCVASEARGAPR